MESVVIIWNPKSGAHRRRDHGAEIATVASTLEKSGATVDVWETRGPGDGAALARRAVDERISCVVASGGDGTFNEILQGMVGSKTKLALWPSGTANVLAGELGLASDGASLVETLRSGRERRISVGRADGRYFFLMAGIGLDASIIRGVRPALKERFGEGAFWVSGIQHYVAWRPEPFRLVADGVECEGAFAAVGNATRYGGGFRVTPLASLDEPTLDVCVFPTRRFAAYYTRDLLAVALGDPTRFGDVVYFKTRRVEARPTGERAPWVQVDGELLGPLPMTFEAVADAVTLVVPRD
jgi:YegS/Rv2252/BmrU family lipid kinase